MKQFLTILFSFFCFVSFAQLPNTHTQSNGHTKEVFLGGINPVKGLINGRYTDTTAANADYIKGEPGVQIIVGNTLYIRDVTGTKWIAAGTSSASTVSILNDSSIIICNSSSCDTFKFTNIVVNNFSVVNDSTIIVCDGNNTCDTLHITPTQIAKPYVDSVKVDGSLVYYYINGNKVLAGTVGGKDGLISGGQVIWSGQGLKFYVSPATYIIGGKFYSSPLDSVTLDPASAFSRVDLFIADTTSHAGKITGIADGNLLTPQVDPSFQLALTTGIQINPEDTIPTNVVVDKVYQDNIRPPDWAYGTQGAAMTIDWGSTTNPYAGTKDIFISQYNNGSTPYFVSPNLYPITTDAVLSFWVYLNGRLNNPIYAWLYDNTTAFGSRFNITSFFNVNDTGKYQLVTVPLSYFQWSPGYYSGNFNTLLFILTGSDSKGFRLDNIQFQKGINSVPSPTDYSNKVDSITIKKITFGSDTANVAINWIKGVPYQKKDTIWTTSTGTGVDSSAYNSADSVGAGMFSLNKRNGDKTVIVLDTDSSGTGGTGSSGSGIQSVTGLNTDNTDPINPVIKISVDGTTITGDGTPANPLVSHSTGTSGGSTNSNIGSGYRLAVPLTNNIKTIFSVSPILVDSVTNSNALTFKFDTSVVHTTAYNNTLYGSVADLASKADKVTTLTINGISYDLSTNRTWTISSSGSSADVKQVYTGTSSVMIADSTTWLVINPSSISSSMTITTPAIPKDKQKIEISFGGTITSGVVVSNLIIAANSGQAILQSSSPSSIMAGETISYRFNAANNIWYRIN